MRATLYRSNKQAQNCKYDKYMIWVKFLSRVLLSSHTSNRGETDNVTSRYTTHHQQQALQSSHFTTSKTHSGIKSIFYPCWFISPQMIHKPAREVISIHFTDAPLTGMQIRSGILSFTFHFTDQGAMVTVGD